MASQGPSKRLPHLPQHRAMRDKTVSIKEVEQETSLVTPPASPHLWVPKKATPLPKNSEEPAALIKPAASVTAAYQHAKSTVAADMEDKCCLTTSPTSAHLWVPKKAAPVTEHFEAPVAVLKPATPPVKPACTSGSLWFAPSAPAKPALWSAPAASSTTSQPRYRARVSLRESHSPSYPPEEARRCDFLTPSFSTHTRRVADTPPLSPRSLPSTSFNSSPRITALSVLVVSSGALPVSTTETTTETEDKKEDDNYATWPADAGFAPPMETCHSPAYDPQGGWTAPVCATSLSRLLNNLPLKELGKWTLSDGVIFRVERAPAKPAKNRGGRTRRVKTEEKRNVEVERKKEKKRKMEKGRKEGEHEKSEGRRCRGGDEGGRRCGCVRGGG